MLCIIRSSLASAKNKLLASEVMNYGTLKKPLLILSAQRCKLNSSVKLTLLGCSLLSPYVGKDM